MKKIKNSKIDIENSSDIDEILQKYKNVDKAEYLKQYPPWKVCDEFKTCAEEADIAASDMHCENCEFYWIGVYLEESEMTNEEYIKSLNISNLSAYLSINNIFCPKGRGTWCDTLSCKNCIEEWLRLPHIA